MHNYWMEKYNADLIYLDFSKGFDLVSYCCYFRRNEQLENFNKNVI